MLFLQFILYSSSFVGTLKIEIPGGALETCQLKIKQFSTDILRFSTKHKANPFTVLWFPALFCLYFMQVFIDWGPIIFRTQVIKKTSWFGPCFQTMISYDYDQNNCQKNPVRRNTVLISNVLFELTFVLHQDFSVFLT